MDYFIVQNAEVQGASGFRVHSTASPGTATAHPPGAPPTPGRGGGVDLTDLPSAGMGPVLSHTGCSEVTLSYGLPT